MSKYDVHLLNTDLKSKRLSGDFFWLFISFSASIIFLT